MKQHEIEGGEPYKSSYSSEPTWVFGQHITSNGFGMLPVRGKWGTAIISAEKDKATGLPVWRYAILESREIEMPWGTYAEKYKARLEARKRREEENRREELERVEKLAPFYAAWPQTEKAQLLYARLTSHGNAYIDIDDIVILLTAIREAPRE